MIATAGHTLQLGERDERRAAVLATRVTLECTCGAVFASELLIAPNGRERARIRAAGWAESQQHLREVGQASSLSSDVGQASSLSPQP